MVFTNEQINQAVNEAGFESYDELVSFLKNGRLQIKKSRLDLQDELANASVSQATQAANAIKQANQSARNQINAELIASLQ